MVNRVLLTLNRMYHAEQQSLITKRPRHPSTSSYKYNLIARHIPDVAWKRRPHANRNHPLLFQPHRRMPIYQASKASATMLDSCRFFLSPADSESTVQWASADGGLDQRDTRGIDVRSGFSQRPRLTPFRTPARSHWPASLRAAAGTRAGR